MKNFKVKIIYQFFYLYEWFDKTWFIACKSSWKQIILRVWFELACTSSLVNQLAENNESLKTFERLLAWTGVQVR